MFAVGCRIVLECHRIDYRILQAIRYRRRGASVRKITEHLADDGDRPVSSHTVQRHIHGLIALGAIRGELIKLPDGRKVCKWHSMTNTTMT